MFLLNNADFPPLSFPTFSKSCSSLSVSLPNACNSLSENIRLRSKPLPIRTNELLFTVSSVLCFFFYLFCVFVSNQTDISSKSFVLNLVFNVSTKSDNHLVWNSVMLFESIAINVCFALIHIHVNVVKSISCHLHVSFLWELMFINLNTVPSLNVCNAVKSVSPAHHICRAFPVLHDVISNHSQA